MKFKTSALAVAAMAAVGFAYSAFAAETSYDKLGFSTNQTFSANASGTSNGSWNVTPVVTESKIEIDSDSTDRFTFTPATANTVNDATELKVKVEASVVPASVDLPVDGNAQCGFAIKDAGDGAKIKVFNGIEWKDATGVTVPTAGNVFVLMVKFDYRSNPVKVQYLIEGTPLVVESSDWVSLATGKTNVGGIDFIGSGLLESLRGDVLQIVSEVIQINPTGSGDVEVKFSEQQLADLKRAVGGNEDLAAVVSALNDQTSQANGNKAFDNYILFNKVTGATETDVPVVKADPAAEPQTANNVIVKVPTLDVQFVEGVTVTHRLRGSNDCSTWVNVGSAITSTREKPNPSFEIGAGTGYRFYRVVTAVSTAK